MSRLPPLNLEKITVGRVFPLDHPLLLLPQLYPLHCAFTGGTGWTQPRVAWERGYITTNSWRIYDTLSRSTLKPHTHTHTHTHTPPFICLSSLAKGQYCSSVCQLSSPPCPSARTGTQLITKASFPSHRDSTAGVAPGLS